MTGVVIAAIVMRVYDFISSRRTIARLGHCWFIQLPRHSYSRDAKNICLHPLLELAGFLFPKHNPNKTDESLRRLFHFARGCPLGPVAGIMLSSEASLNA